MKKYVVYNGGTETKIPACTNPSILVKGKRYEVLIQTLEAENNTYTLKNIEGYFDVKWFDDENAVTVVKNKPVYFAKAVVYGDISNFLYSMLRLKKLVKEKYKMITTNPIISIVHVYSSIYKLETKDEVYITDVLERTVG